MATGRPVLVSDVAPLKRIVEESECGLVFKAEDPYDFSEKLRIMKDPELLKKLAHNGRIAAENQYNWQKDKERLLNLYAELFNPIQNKLQD
jgi:glycosyltransferase involved in cell wall biosynthesis